ncbi:MAG TPA: nucleotidyltransferase family protein [Acidobacteriota bacterium]|nr:nucleotidyltransferase family protein [Acidobacteriota bacterium]
MITGLVLAAGQGKRIGTVKPLLPSDQGTMLEVVLSGFRAASLDALVVVLGYEARRIIQQISLADLKVVINGEHRAGVSASIQRGLAHIPPGSRAVMIGMGDMPLVTAATINTLIREYKKSKKGVVVPVHNKQRGHPVIIDLKYLDDLLALRGDVGARSILEAHADDIREVKIKSDEILIDVDTREAWAEAQERLSNAVTTAAK